MENNYRKVRLVNCSNDETKEIILLNNKFSVDDLQKAIDKIKDEKWEEIMLYGDDWQIILENLDDEFIYSELDYTDEDKDIEEFVEF